MPTLCVNGTCIDGINEWHCNCTAGFTGDHCETEIDECASSPCSAKDVGATCIDLLNTFSCVCNGDFTGELCELGSSLHPNTLIDHKMRTYSCFVFSVHCDRAGGRSGEEGWRPVQCFGSCEGQQYTRCINFFHMLFLLAQLHNRCFPDRDHSAGVGGLRDGFTG